MKNIFWKLFLFLLFVACQSRNRVPDIRSPVYPSQEALITKAGILSSDDTFTKISKDIKGYVKEYKSEVNNKNNTHSEVVTDAVEKIIEKPSREIAEIIADEKFKDAAFSLNEIRESNQVVLKDNDSYSVGNTLAISGGLIVLFVGLDDYRKFLTDYKPLNDLNRRRMQIKKDKIEANQLLFDYTIHKNDLNKMKYSDFQSIKGSFTQSELHKWIIRVKKIVVLENSSESVADQLQRKLKMISLDTNNEIEIKNLAEYVDFINQPETEKYFRHVKTIPSTRGLRDHLVESSGLTVVQAENQMRIYEKLLERNGMKIGADLKISYQKKMENIKKNDPKFSFSKLHTATPFRHRVRKKTLLSGLLGITLMATGASLNSFSLGTNGLSPFRKLMKNFKNIETRILYVHSNM